MKKNILCLLLVVLLTAGCANMTDRQQTIFQGTVIGVAAGAATGAAIGQAIGRNTSATLIGAGVGGLVAGIAGAAYGTHVADQKNKYANDEEYLEACIAVAEQASEQAESYNVQLKKDISSLEKKVQDLVVQYNKKQVNTAIMRNQQKHIEKQLAQLNINHQAIITQIAKFKGALANGQNATTTSIASLDKEIHKLELAAEELESQTSALASIDQSIKL